MLHDSASSATLDTDREQYSRIELGWQLSWNPLRFWIRNVDRRLGRSVMDSARRICDGGGWGRRVGWLTCRHLTC